EAMARSLAERFATAHASPAAKTDLAMLLGALKSSVRRRRVERPLQRKPGIYLDPLDALFAMTARKYGADDVRARAVGSRLEKIPGVVKLARENLLNPPKVWTEIAIERASGAKSFLEEQRAFLVAALPGETPKVDAALKGAVAAYEDYKQYLQRS